MVIIYLSSDFKSRPSSPSSCRYPSDTSLKLHLPFSQSHRLAVSPSHISRTTNSHSHFHFQSKFSHPIAHLQLSTHKHKPNTPQHRNPITPIHPPQPFLTYTTPPLHNSRWRTLNRNRKRSIRNIRHHSRRIPIQPIHTRGRRIHRPKHKLVIALAGRIRYRGAVPRETGCDAIRRHAGVGGEPDLGEGAGCWDNVAVDGEVRMGWMEKGVGWGRGEVQVEGFVEGDGGGVCGYGPSGCGGGGVDGEGDVCLGCGVCGEGCLADVGESCSC